MGDFVSCQIACPVERQDSFAILGWKLPNRPSAYGVQYNSFAGLGIDSVDQAWKGDGVSDMIESANP